MAQPPPQPNQPATFASRAMQPIRNPVYAYDVTDDFKATPQPTHILERPPSNSGPDPRLTAQGSLPPVHGLTPIVPMAIQGPYNVWALYPQ